jgi:PAS domain S-box-containing protein
MPRKLNISDDPVELRRRAEARLRDQRKGPRSKAGDQLRKGSGSRSAADTLRMLHELEVHQIELEMQNAELHKARDEMEAVLERYTDLYDFAPVGYLSIDAEGLILEVNLTGAALLGVERSRLIRLRLERFVTPASRTIFRTFLEKVFAGTKDQVCEALLLKEGGDTFWASFRATAAVFLKGTQKWCRVSFGDITVRKQAEETRRRLENLAGINRELTGEIARRQTVEKALRKSQQHQSRLLKQSHLMQEQLRHLSHQILHAQEEERKRISHELHDEIAQTLVGINVHLAALTREVVANPRGLRQKIARTQRLVEKSVDVVHLFARELRPAALDDLGLVPALHAFMKEFTRRTGIHIHFKTFSSSRIEQLNNATRTVFYRVTQEALTNVARHAKASFVEVNFEKLPDAICLEIKDDGKSFPAHRIMHSKRNTRLGLIGMRERLEMVGGNFSVESAPGKGTTVRAQIPLANCRGEGTENPLMAAAKTKP